MERGLSDTQIRTLLDRTAEDLPVVAGHLPETIRRIREYQARGYPKSSGAGKARGGDGLTMPEREAERPDRYATDHQQALKFLIQLADAAHYLEALVHRYEPVAELTDADPICTSCKRLHEVSDVYRTDLCSWCYLFSLDWGCIPPIEVLRKHHERGRVTEADIKKALRAQPRLTRVKRKKGRKPDTEEAA